MDGPALEVTGRQQEIVELVGRHQVVVISGETGCGKTTQIPQYLLEAGVLERQLGEVNVVVTQPRRMAAVAMAERVAQERGQKVGQQVGYQIRFQQQISPHTRLRYVTDAILLHQLVGQGWPYTVYVIDEAHERSLNSEVVMALLKQRLMNTKEPRLKVVVMSATLEHSLFKEYFEGLTVGTLHIPGRQHEVDIMYSPVATPVQQQVTQAVTSVIRMHLHEPEGDILVFLNGRRDCEQALKETTRRLEELVEQDREVPGMLMLALYSTQSSQQQQRVFEASPGQARKVVYSTNIAETSLTLPNIGYVIDNGTQKSNEQSVGGLNSLVVQTISSNQAQQRAGRAGRTQPGKVYRLYTLDQHKDMHQYQQPEILRVDLSHALLQLKCLGIQDVLNFDYIQRPDREKVVAALRLLYVLQAVGRDHQVTALGRAMSKYPLLPIYSKVMLVALVLGCGEDMSVVLAMLSSEPLWSKDHRAERTRHEIKHEGGDHETMLRAYRRWVRRGCQPQYSKHKGYNQRALVQAHNVVQQLQEINTNMDMGPIQERLYQDPIYKMAQETQVGGSDKLRMALSAGLFIKSGRRLPCSDEYLLVPEGRPCIVDQDSTMLLTSLPDHLIFSEMFSHQGQQPTISGLSRVHQSWVQPYIKAMEELQNEEFLLEVQSIKRKVDPEKEKEINRLERQAMQQEKLEEAKQRFIQRKKFHGQ